MYYFPVSALLIEYLILTIVDSRDSYGYEMSQTIKLVADIKESTLYPILKRLEKAGYVTTYSQEFQGRKENITPSLLPAKNRCIICIQNGTLTGILLMELSKRENQTLSITTKKEYLDQLHKYLKKLPREDYEDAMEYFTEYFEETDDEGAQKLMEELGTPKQAARDLIGNLLTENKCLSHFCALTKCI